MKRPRPSVETLQSDFPAVMPDILEALIGVFPSSVVHAKMDTTLPNPVQAMALEAVRILGQQDVIGFLAMKRDEQVRLSKQHSSLSP